jgi:hypothetical protein
MNNVGCPRYVWFKDFPADTLERFGLARKLAINAQTRHGLSGPARAAIGGPDTPGHDDEGPGHDDEGLGHDDEGVGHDDEGP